MSDIDEYIKQMTIPHYLYLEKRQRLISKKD